MSSTPLAARSPNTHLASSNNEQDLKTASTNMNSMDHHRQVLQGKLDSQEKYVFLLRFANHFEDFGLDQLLTLQQRPQTYVSPSDDIMSHCSKKLSDLKGKRFKKYVHPHPFLMLLNR